MTPYGACPPLGQDINVLYHIQKTLGFGQVTMYTEKIFGRYRVSNQKDIELLIHLFNGNLVLNKRINQLQVWLSIYDKIPFINNTIKLTLNSAWLSGFTDAEGSFRLILTYNKIEK